LLQFESPRKKMVARLSERPVKTAIEGTAGTSLLANSIVPQIFYQSSPTQFKAQSVVTVSKLF
jgi:hypothetical protein